MNSSSSCTLSESDQEHLFEKLDVFKVKGRDKRGRKVLLIIGKNFPGKNLIGMLYFVSFRIQEVYLVYLFD